MRKKEGERDWERTGRREKPTGTENKRRENSTKLWNFQKQMTMVTNWHTWASWNRSWPFRKPRCCLIHNAELPKSLGTGTTRCFGTVSKTGVKNSRVGTSLVVEWLRICLAMQGTWVFHFCYKSSWREKSHSLSWAQQIVSVFLTKGPGKSVYNLLVSVDVLKNKFMQTS